MEHKGIFAAVLVLVIIIIGMFIFTYIQKSEIENKAPEIVTPVENNKYTDIERIDAKYFFVDGIHTLVGKIFFPTACDLLSWDTIIAESYPEQVLIKLDAVNHSDTCVATVTSQRFKISFKASEQADITAKFMGRSVELNLIPGSLGESPEDFELFIKG